MFSNNLSNPVDIEANFANWCIRRTATQIAYISYNFDLVNLPYTNTAKIVVRNIIFLLSNKGLYRKKDFWEILTCKSVRCSFEFNFLRDKSCSILTRSLRWKTHFFCVRCFKLTSTIVSRTNCWRTRLHLLLPKWALLVKSILCKWAILKPTR